MYLPSKIKLRILAVYALVIFLLFLPFKGIIQNSFVFFFHQLTITPKESSRQIEKLKKENISLQLQAEKFRTLEAENQQLKEILGFKKTKEIDLIGADVLSFSPSSWRRHLLINAGKNQGLKKGLLVVDTRGRLMGKVSEVKKTFSTIVLINDPNFNLSVFVGESANGLLKGSLIGAKVLYIENENEVKKGDRVWVKPASCSSPIKIGEVKKVKKSESALFCDIEVKLAHQGAFFDKVFVVRQSHPFRDK